MLRLRLVSRSCLQVFSSSYLWPGKGIWVTKPWSRSRSLNHARCKFQFSHNQRRILMISRSLSRYALVFYAFLTRFSLLLFSYVSSFRRWPMMYSCIPLTDNVFATVHSYLLPSGETPHRHSVRHRPSPIYVGSRSVCH